MSSSYTLFLNIRKELFLNCYLKDFQMDFESVQTNYLVRNVSASGFEA